MGPRKSVVRIRILGGALLGAGVGRRGWRLSISREVAIFRGCFLRFRRENRAFSTRALRRDSGWDPVTDLHSLADGRYCSSGQIPLSCPVRSSWFTQSAVELYAISFAVLSGSGRVVVVLLPGE